MATAEEIEKTKAKIEVMQGYADGKQIEYKSDYEWKDCPDPMWDWVCFDYRIKPEPKEPTYRPYKDIVFIVLSVMLVA